MLAVVLVLLCLVCLLGEVRVRGPARYARIGAAARRVAAVSTLGPLRWPVFLGFAGLAATTLGVPVGMIVYWLLQHAHAATSPVVPSLPLLLRATGASIGYGLGAAAATLALALPLGYLVTRYRAP